MYDFIVVGGENLQLLYVTLLHSTDGWYAAGPSGIAAATSLARSSKKITVLLLEAGDSNSDPVLRVDGQRWLTFQSPEMNWGYKTVPQVECYDRKIDYSRGKGLGGSSAINFGVYTIGCRDDYDEWARIVGDSSFGWEKMHARFKQLETFHGDLPSQSEQKYANPKQMDHGYQGGLHVGYAKEWERDLGPMLDVFDAAGFNLNADVNSGNPLGMSVAINSSYRGRRTTAKDLLQSPQENLVVLTGVQVQKLLWDGKKVVGVKSNINECMFSTRHPK
jgi:choline dehydrogenase-like flavoprotein